jgi:hypothetical protein
MPLGIDGFIVATVLIINFTERKIIISNLLGAKS